MPVRSPAVWGIIRPTLILPVDFASQLSPRSLRWALMHELAHLRRYDLLLHAIQRVLLMLQFWNPVAWIASYFVSQYRERACDDMALAWTDGDAVSAGEAFMYVVKMATDQRTLARAPTSLGVISSGGKRACKQRLKRLLDTDRPIRERVGPVALLFLLVVAVCVLPQHRTSTTHQNALEILDRNAQARRLVWRFRGS